MLFCENLSRLKYHLDYIRTIHFQIDNNYTKFWVGGTECTTVDT